MKTRTISFLFSILIISSLIFLFQKKLNCQTSEHTLSNHAGAGQSRVSISDPDAIPDSGPMFADMWASPEYIVLDYIPDDVKVYQARQPVITNQQILVPTLSNPSGVLVFDRSGHYQRRIEFDSKPDAIADIHIYPEVKRILVGDGQQKRISVYDLDGVRKEDKQVGFHFLYFAYSPSADRYIFYLTGNGAKATEGATPFAITITDAKFNILHQFFPLSSLAFKAPFFSSQRFQVDADRVYYNPDYSDQLYAIDFNGSIDLLLDLELADQAYFDKIDILTERPFTPALVQSLKEKLAVDYFLIGKQYAFIGTIPGKHNKDLVIQRSSAKSMLVNNSTLITNFGDHFNFGYTRPSFMMGDKCVSLRNARDFNLIWDNIDAKETLSHLPGRMADNQWMMMLYIPNDKVWFPANEETRPAGSLPIEMNPNPANQWCTIRMAGDAGKYGLEIYSMDGVMRFDEKGEMSDGSMQKRVDVSNWTPGAYVVQCTLGEEVYAKTLVVQ